MWIADYPGLSFHENRRFCLFSTKSIISVFFCLMISWLFFIHTFSLITADSLHQFIEYFYIVPTFFLTTFNTLWFYKKRNRFRECLEIFEPDFLKCMDHNLKRHHEIYNTGIRECNFMYYMWSLLLHGSGVLWILGPLVSYMIDISINSRSYAPGSYTILSVAYPFSINYSPVFELIIALELILFLIMVEQFRLSELTFMYIVSMTCTQIRILSSSLYSIKGSNENNGCLLYTSRCV